MSFYVLALAAGRQLDTIGATYRENPEDCYTNKDSVEFSDVKYLRFHCECVSHMKIL